MTTEQSEKNRNIISVLFRTAFSQKYGIRCMLRGCYEGNVQTEKARIKVGNMHADFLMQCPGYDDCWPSDEAVPRMEKILQAEYADQDACNRAREDSLREALDFLEGWK